MLDPLMSIISNPVTGFLSVFGGMAISDIFAAPTIKDPVERARMWTLYGPDALRSAERVTK